MIRALKVVMIVFGVIMILVGLANLIVPDLQTQMHGVPEGPGYTKWMAAMFGAALVIVGVWVIVAGRDPLQHIYWVKFLITWCIVALVIHIYSIIQGYVDFSQAGVSIIIDGVFAVLLLAFYPWRAVRISE
jgi:hypothetical protein